MQMKKNAFQATVRGEEKNEQEKKEKSGEFVQGIV